MATEKYTYKGSKVPGKGAGRVILEGSVSDPKRYVDVGKDIDLSEDEVKNLRAKGLNLVKIGEADDEPDNTADTPEQQQEDQASGAPSGGDEAKNKSGAGKPAGR